MDTMPTELLCALLDAVAREANSLRAAYQILWRLRQVNRRFKAVVEQHLATWMRDHSCNIHLTVRSLECLAVMASPPPDVHHYIPDTPTTNGGGSLRSVTPDGLPHDPPTQHQQSPASTSPRLVPLSASFPSTPGEEFPLHDIWGIDSVQLSCQAYDPIHKVYEFVPVPSHDFDDGRSTRMSISSTSTREEADIPGLIKFSRIRSSDMIRELKFDFDGWHFGEQERRTVLGDHSESHREQHNRYRDRLYRLDLGDISGRHYVGECDLICAYRLQSIETDVVRWVPKPGTKRSTNENGSDKIAIRATDRRFELQIERILVRPSWLLNGMSVPSLPIKPQQIFKEHLPPLENLEMPINIRSEFILHYLQRFFTTTNTVSTASNELISELLFLLRRYHGLPDKRSLIDQICRQEHPSLPEEAYWQEPTILRYLFQNVASRTPSLDRRESGRLPRANISASDLMQLSWDGVTIRLSAEIADPTESMDKAATVVAKWLRKLDKS